MKLTSELQKKITANPTYTILRSESEQLNIKHIAAKYKPYILDIPENFSGKDIWKNLITPVRDQSLCGSCWAFASTSMLADRFNIQSDGKYNILLSPTKLILCSKDFEGNINILNTTQTQKKKEKKENISNIKTSACYGNSLYNALQYLYIFGSCLEECIPYTKNLGIENQYQQIGDFTSSVQLPLCSYVSGPLSDMCADYFISDKTGVEGGTPQRFYRAFDVYSIQGVKKDNGSEMLIRQEIYRWGPVVSAIKIYSNFYTFDAKNDIYRWDGIGDQIGGHAIKILGWGVENGIAYWQVENSWGIDWGDNGYFKMIRGINECEIEENVFAVIPDFFYPSNSIFKEKLFLNSKNNELSELRHNIDNNINIIGGGINPETGYSRRVMETFYIDFMRPVPLSELPNNLHTFTLDSKLENLNKKENIFIAANIRSNIRSNKNGFNVLYILIILFLIIFFLLNYFIKIL